MNEVAPPKDSTEIETRIREWIKNNPDRENAGERMLIQLSRIKTEFTGSTQKRLEALVFETLERQLRIDESRRVGLEAAKRLSQSVQKLTETMSQCLVSAQKAHKSVETTLGALQAKVAPKKQSTLVYVAPKQVDKRRMN